VSAIKYLFDEDLNGRIVRGVRRRLPNLDSTTVQEAALHDPSDPGVLEWAAGEARVVVSHDHRTMRAYAEERLKAELPMAGLILARRAAPIAQIIDDLVLVVPNET
jgi:predicted nuclease of predicted toxin-antitoxin system